MKTIQVTVNGETMEVSDQLTIADLLREAKVPANYLAVEVNDEVVPRALHLTQRVVAGDRIEVVTLVGGG
jgi:sulfur carrier protein